MYKLKCTVFNQDGNNRHSSLSPGRPMSQWPSDFYGDEKIIYIFSVLAFASEPPHPIPCRMLSHILSLPLWWGELKTSGLFLFLLLFSLLNAKSPSQLCQSGLCWNKLWRQRQQAEKVEMELEFISAKRIPTELPTRNLPFSHFLMFIIGAHNPPFCVFYTLNDGKFNVATMDQSHFSPLSRSPCQSLREKVLPFLFYLFFFVNLYFFTNKLHHCKKKQSKKKTNKNDKKTNVLRGEKCWQWSKPKPTIATESYWWTSRIVPELYCQTQDNWTCILVVSANGTGHLCVLMGTGSNRKQNCSRAVVLCGKCINGE